MKKDDTKKAENTGKKGAANTDANKAASAKNETKKELTPEEKKKQNYSLVVKDKYKEIQKANPNKTEEELKKILSSPDV